jgi:hypothetical protein
MSDLLTGVCRNVFPWTDNKSVLNVGFGTHSNLQTWQGGVLTDITPLGPPTRLGASPFTVSNGSATISVSETAHGRATSDTVKIANSVSVGRLTIVGGPFTITVDDANTWHFTFGSNASVSKTLGSSPIATTISSPTVTFTETGHNIADQTTITISGASAVGGITPNGTFVATVIDANTYQITFTSNATSTATGGGSAVVVAVPTTGGGSQVVVTKQTALPAGAVNGSGTLGFGSGPYGTGPWGETPETAMFFPQTWSLAAWGQELLASPRGGGLYLWNNDTGAKSLVVAQAPTEITHMLVAPMNGGYMCFALGTQEEASGTFNPMCIRHSAVRDLTTWTTNFSTTAREYTLTGGGRIVAGRMAGPYILVWTNDDLWLGNYQGDLNQPWAFNRVGESCGLLGPNAAIVVGQTAFWVSPDLQFYSYSIGGQPEPVPCPILSDFQQNLAPTQADKVVASSNAKFQEIRFDYPDGRDGFENSRYVALCVNGPDVGSWYRGIMGRTAMVDANPALFPIGATAAGNVYYHERGQTADGQAFGWYIESADQLFDPNYRTLVKQVWPDSRGQVGPVTVSVKARETPQGDETSVSAPPMGPSDSKADLMISGRMLRVRFEGNSAPTSWRLGKPIFDTEQAGLL